MTAEYGKRGAPRSGLLVYKPAGGRQRRSGRRFSTRRSHILRSHIAIDTPHTTHKIECTNHPPTTDLWLGRVRTSETTILARILLLSSFSSNTPTAYSTYTNANTACICRGRSSQPVWNPRRAWTFLCYYLNQPLVELYGSCMVVLKVS
jgi:hypothetical protein